MNMKRRSTSIPRVAGLIAGLHLALAVGGIALPATANAAAAETVPPQPGWSKLTPQQREILQPLSGEWDRLNDLQRKRWLSIAQRYSQTSPEERQRITQRMKNWRRLTPDERQKARERYKTLRNATPEQRAAIKQKWKEYKQLPDAEKEHLRHQARNPRPALQSAPPAPPATGAAQPVAKIPIPTPATPEKPGP